MLLEETDIDSILEGKTEYYPEMVVHTVEEMARNFCDRPAQQCPGTGH